MAISVSDIMSKKLETVEEMACVQEPGLLAAESSSHT
jgi:hypothetical protein